MTKARTDARAGGHIVLVHRYFFPDTPLYATLLKLLAEDLAQDGHCVTVLTAQPNYTGASQRAPSREQIAPHVEVRRFMLLPEGRKVGIARMANMALFPLRVLLSGVWLRGVDIIMAATAPPVVSAVAASLLAKRHRAAFVYHNQDIYPEVALAAGVLRSQRVASILRALDRRNHLSAACTVVLSEDMRQTVEARGLPPERIVVINNFDPFASESVAGTSAHRRHGGEERLVATFTGNLGRFQGLEAILDAAELLQEAPVEFDLIGDGALRSWLQTEAERRSLSNITFRGFQPPAEVERFLRADADVGIVCLAPGVIRTAYPSKTFSYLRHGCAVVALVEPDSELARSIGDRGIGFVCPPGDGKALAEALRACAIDHELLGSMRARAGEFAAESLSPVTRLAEWRKLFRFLLDETRQGDQEV